MKAIVSVQKTWRVQSSFLHHMTKSKRVFFPTRSSSLPECVVTSTQFLVPTQGFIPKDPQLVSTFDDMSGIPDISLVLWFCLSSNKKLYGSYGSIWGVEWVTSLWPVATVEGAQTLYIYIKKSCYEYELDGGVSIISTIRGSKCKSMHNAQDHSFRSMRAYIRLELHPYDP